MNVTDRLIEEVRDPNMYCDDIILNSINVLLEQQQDILDEMDYLCYELDYLNDESPNVYRNTRKIDVRQQYDILNIEIDAKIQLRIALQYELKIRQRKIKFVFI